MAKKKTVKKPSLEVLKSDLEKSLIYARACEAEVNICEQELNFAEEDCDKAWEVYDKLKEQIEELEKK